MTTQADDAAFHLIVHDDEHRTLRLALSTFRDDFGHNERRVALVVDEVIATLERSEGPLPLSEAGLKVTWSALHTALDDTRREQHDERERLRALLDRLPSDRDIEIIDLDRALRRTTEPPTGGPDARSE